MNFVSKTRNGVSKTRNCELNMMDLAAFTVASLNTFLEIWPKWLLFEVEAAFLVRGDLSIAGMYIQSSREIYQSPACIYNLRTDNVLLKKDDFRLKSVDFLLKSVDFLLKHVDFIIKSGDHERARVLGAGRDTWPGLGAHRQPPAPPALLGTSARRCVTAPNKCALCSMYI